MNMSVLMNICDRGCSVKNIFAFEHTHSSIVKNTVRSPGQYVIQRFFYISGGSIEFVLNNKKRRYCLSASGYNIQIHLARQ